MLKEVVRRLMFFLPLFALGSCDTSVGPVPPAILSVDVNSDYGALVARLEVDLNESAEVQVDYWTAASPRLRVTSSAAEEHDILLPRLIADAVYDFEVRTTLGGRTSDPTSGEFVTDTLPTALAQVRFTARGTPSFGLSVLSLRGPDAFVVVDGDGQIVWYWLSAAPPQAAKKMPNGDFALLDNIGGGVTIVAVDGSTVARLQPQDIPVSEARVHHDLVPTASNTILFLALARDQVVFNDTAWAGEEIVEWDPRAGIETVRWESHHFFSPGTHRGERSIPSDWLHANSLSIGPRGNLVMSLHFLDQVFSIAPDYQSIEWRIGGPGSTYALDADAVFSGQHTATELANGNVVIFDNGFERAAGGQYSRALELGRGGGVVSNVWEFRPRPDNYARIISSAWRLSNGNTHVTFGTSAGTAQSSTGPIEVYDVGSDGVVDWHLEVEGPRSMFRGTPITSIGGEVVVRQ